jgi:methionyl-tRNA formyltransferase
MEETEITDTDTTGTLHDKLMVLGSGLIIKNYRGYFKRRGKATGTG